MGAKSPVTIRGITYPSVRAAAAALKVSRQAISMANIRGTLETAGLPYDPTSSYMPVCINGIQYTSAGHAAAKLNVTRTTIVKILASGRADSYVPTAYRKPLHRMANMLITNDDITAMANICRWGGYTNRHFSVLEHSLVGAKCIEYFNPEHKKLKRAFLLHDAEEPLLMGDLPSLKKKKWCNADYFAAADVIKSTILGQAGVSDVPKMEIKYWDRVMMAAEHHAVYIKDDVDEVIRQALDLTEESHVDYAIKLIGLRDYSFATNKVIYRKMLRESLK